MGLGHARQTTWGRGTAVSQPRRSSFCEGGNFQVCTSHVRQLRTQSARHDNFIRFWGTEAQGAPRGHGWWPAPGVVSHSSVDSGSGRAALKLSLVSVHPARTDAQSPGRGGRQAAGRRASAVSAARAWGAAPGRDRPVAACVAPRLLLMPFPIYVVTKDLTEPGADTCPRQSLSGAGQPGRGAALGGAAGAVGAGAGASHGPKRRRGAPPALIPSRTLRGPRLVPGRRQALETDARAHRPLETVSDFCTWHFAETPSSPGCRGARQEDTFPRRVSGLETEGHGVPGQAVCLSPCR